MSDNTHAAMCVYCGESIIYDTREVTDMAAAHAQIIEHDQQCPKNPMVDRFAFLYQQNFTLQEQCDEYRNHLAVIAEMTGNKGDIGAAHEGVNAVIEERDALAAHVEQLQEAGDKLREPWDLSKILGAETRRRVEGWDKARAESPASSLARRDALKEAETVEKWADCLESIIRHVEAEHSKDPNYPAIGAEGMGEFAADMRTEAENLRKKAEGHQ